MISFDNVTKENLKEHNPNWPEVPGHQYRILIVGGPGSGETNALPNIINHVTDIDKIYLHAKNPYEANYQLLIKKRKITGLKYLMIQKIILVTQMIWMIFIKILKNTIQIKKEKL